METENFRQLVATNAHNVMICKECLEDSTPDDLPQPGWVGSRYERGKGLVFVLKNPKRPANYSESRDAKMQTQLKAFKEKGTLESYEQMAKTFIDDAIGVKEDEPAWSDWKTVVGEIADSYEKIAWLNVVKVRTESTTPYQRSHGVNQHLREELIVLKPAMIVSVYTEAITAVNELESVLGFGFVHFPLKGTEGRKPPKPDIADAKKLWLDLCRSTRG